MQNYELFALLKNYTNGYILSSAGLGDENIVLLARKGYTHLHAIALDQSIYSMPLYTWVKYSYNNMYDTHYPEGMFDAVYNLSPQIKDLEQYLREAARILDHGGLLILNKELQNHETLRLAEEMNLEETDLGKGLLVFKNKQMRGSLPTAINVVLSTLDKVEGTVFTTRTMQSRLAEYGVQAHLYKTFEEAPKTRMTIIEWSIGLFQPIPDDPSAIIQSHELLKPTNDIAFSWGRLFKDKGYKWWLLNYALGKVKPTSNTSIAEVNNEIQKHPLVVFSYELAEYAGIKNFVIAPHVIPKSNQEILAEAQKIDKNYHLHIGSYGFAAWYKNYDQFCELALRLGIRATLLLSVNHNTPESIVETEGFSNALKGKYDGKGQIKIKTGLWTNEQLARELSDCTHLISSQTTVRNVSSSMRFMASLAKPIISPDNYQSREGQAIRVRSLEDVTIDFLNTTRAQVTNMDDGIRYLLCILKAENKKRQAKQ